MFPTPEVWNLVAAANATLTRHRVKLAEDSNGPRPWAVVVRSPQYLPARRRNNGWVISSHATLESAIAKARRADDAYVPPVRHPDAPVAAKTEA
jgi:hypothetical protein